MFVMPLGDVGSILSDNLEVVKNIVLFVPVITLGYHYVNYRANHRELSYLVKKLAPSRLLPDAAREYRRLSTGEPPYFPRAIRFRLRNSGRQPIRRTDFDDDLPITVTFPGSIVAYISLPQLNPANLPVHIEPEQSSFDIAPLLLNPKDTVQLDLLVKAWANETEVSARIAGIRYPIIDPGTTLRNQIVLILVGLFLSLIGSALSILATLIAPEVLHRVQELVNTPIVNTITILGILIAVFTSFASLGYRVRLRRRNDEISDETEKAESPPEVKA